MFLLTNNMAVGGFERTTLPFGGGRRQNEQRLGE